MDATTNWEQSWEFSSEVDGARNWKKTCTVFTHIVIYLCGHSKHWEDMMDGLCVRLHNCQPLKKKPVAQEQTVCVPAGVPRLKPDLTVSPYAS